MLRNKLKQIGQLAKIILFFTLFSVNIYLSCIYLRSIPELEYISGMFLGVFILQLFFCKPPVIPVFSATPSISIFVPKNEIYDDTRRSCRNYYVLQGIQSNL